MWIRRWHVYRWCWWFVHIWFLTTVYFLFFPTIIACYKLFIKFTYEYLDSWNIIRHPYSDALIVPFEQSARQHGEQLAALSTRLDHLRAELERLARRSGGALPLAAANSSSAANPPHPHTAQTAPAGGGGFGPFANQNHHGGYGFGVGEPGTGREKENMRLASGGGRLNPEEKKNLWVSQWWLSIHSARVATLAKLSTS